MVDKKPEVENKQIKTREIKLLSEVLVLARNRFDNDAKTENKKIFADMQIKNTTENHKELNDKDVLVNIFLLRNDSKTRNTLDNITAGQIRKGLNIPSANW